MKLPFNSNLPVYFALLEYEDEMVYPWFTIHNYHTIQHDPMGSKHDCEGALVGMRLGLS
jgi:hypothetical protein